MLNTTTNIYNSLMYKNTTKIFNTRYWLLFDNNHYHSITNIKGFLATKYFCHTCCHCFEKENTFKKHNCADCEMGQNYSKKNRKQVRNSTINKELSHYLNKKAMKGGMQEVKEKMKHLINIMEVNGESMESEETKKYLEKKLKYYKDKIFKDKIISFDIETDTHTNTHIPNHIDADVLSINGTNHEYNDCKIDTFSHTGLDCIDKFCKWLFTNKNANATVMAHNMAGFDGKFILQWCLKHDLHPSRYIRKGSRIMCME